MSILIADSGSTKCEWCFISNGKKQIVTTQGASPYFLNEAQIIKLMRDELLPVLKKRAPHTFIFMARAAQQLQTVLLFAGQ